MEDVGKNITWTGWVGYHKKLTSVLHLSCTASSSILLGPRLKLMSISICKVTFILLSVLQWVSEDILRIKKTTSQQIYFCWLRMRHPNCADKLYFYGANHELKKNSGCKVWTHHHPCTSMKNHTCAMTTAISDCLTLVFLKPDVNKSDVKTELKVATELCAIYIW